ncbi:MAG: Gfo/Idh/MocA family oxidoreductase [Verrucomicrobiota bacterium]
MENKENLSGKGTVSRRQFVKTASTVSAASIFGFQVVPSRVFGANDRINLGAIGTGGKGAADIAGAVGAGMNVIALCDVVDIAQTPEPGGGRVEKLVGTRNDHPNAKFYMDWREMLEKEKDIDAVTISTPDHHHAHASITAMKMGKHVYCQKPLTHGIWEARMMAKVAEETGVKTQMGNQAHAQDHMRRCVELIRAGMLGNVNQAYAWTNRPIWPQGMPAYPEKMDVPHNLDWDIWCGPAQMVDYSDKITPFNWRGYWEFGTGAFGDMACHIMDMAYWALELGSPEKIDVEAHGGTDVSCPIWSKVTYYFPARGEGTKPVRFIWYDGSVGAEWDDAEWKHVGGEPNLPTASVLDGVDPLGKTGFGTIVIGDEGRLYFNRGKPNWMVRPSAGLDGFDFPEETLSRAPDQDPYKEWMRAIQGGPEPLANFQQAGPFTETVLLGVLAQRLQKSFEWDAEKMEVKGMPEASEWVRRQYREGWELEV